MYSATEYMGKILLNLLWFQNDSYSFLTISIIFYFNKVYKKIYRVQLNFCIII